MTPIMTAGKKYKLELRPKFWEVKKPEAIVAECCEIHHLSKHSIYILRCADGSIRDFRQDKDTSNPDAVKTNLSNYTIHPIQ